MKSYLRFALILTFCLLPAVAAGQTPEVSLIPDLPDTNIIPLQDSVVVDLVVNQHSVDLKGYSVRIWYNPSVLQIDSVTEGHLLASSGSPTFFDVNYQSQPQFIYIDGAILGDGVTASGAGPLAHIWYSSVGYGVCDLLFWEFEARDGTNENLPYDQFDNWVRVCPYLGDVNNDHLVNITDAVYLIEWIFDGGPTPIPNAAVGDVNCDALTNITDVVYLINYIFAGGPPPCDICSDDP